ncbi:hypothetical protein D3C85_1370070 [compost metagenome]
MLAVEHAQNRVFAEQPRHDRYPNIDVALADDGAEAAILRDTPLRDVQLGEYLDPGNDLLGQFPPGEGIHRDQHAIQAQPDDKARGDVLQVDVASAVVHRVEQDGIQAAYGWMLFLEGVHRDGHRRKVIVSRSVGRDVL